MAVAERDVTRRSQAWIAAALGPGGVALDATCGNGHDTLFLARSVAPGGTVHAIDLQAQAIEHTRRRLEAAGAGAGVCLHHGDHACAQRLLDGARLDAAMFNLGWLPRGPAGVVTRPGTTVAALAAVLALLRPGGRLAVVCYRGHAGGPAEEAAVRRWLNAAAARVRALEPGDAPAHAPRLYVLDRAMSPVRACAPRGTGWDRGVRGRSARLD